MATTQDDNAIAVLAFDFVQYCSNTWTLQDLPPEPMARSFMTHCALMVSAIVGAPQCAAELREMADQIELGQAPVAGRG